MTESQRPRPGDFAIELDVLRGVAAVMMIVNHAGLRLLSAEAATTAPTAAPVFLGSFAPVVFFFATGFGVGLGMRSAPHPASRTASALWKALLLLAADQFFYWKNGQPWGVNFFGFIGIALVVVTLIAGTRRPLAWSLGLAVSLLVLRYGLGPPLLHTPLPTFVDWLIGARGVDNLAYPLSPWMVYPLCGFALGLSYRPLASQPTGYPWLSRAVWTAGGASAVALLMFFAGNVFFRWGTVSSAYFVLSISVLAGCGALALVLAKFANSTIVRSLALRGVASFAVIPLHYAMLDAATVLCQPPLGPWATTTLTLIIILASFRMASKFSSMLSAPLLRSHRPLVAGVLLLALGVSALATLRYAVNGPNAVAGWVLLGQLAVAGLLGMRISQTARTGAAPLTTMK